MKQSTADFISVQKKFKRTFWIPPLGHEFDTVVKWCLMVVEQERSSCPQTPAYTKLATRQGESVPGQGVCGGSRGLLGAHLGNWHQDLRTVWAPWWW